MNIIIPEDPSVDSVLIDIRFFDVPKNKIHPGLDPKDFLFYFPRNLFVKNGQDVDFKTIQNNIMCKKTPKFINYLLLLLKNKSSNNEIKTYLRLFEAIRNEYLINSDNSAESISLSGKLNIIRLPKDKKVNIPAPYGGDHEISVETIEPPFSKDGYYGKNLEVSSLGKYLTRIHSKEPELLEMIEL